ncbi:leucine-rich repeat-containing protein 34 isoform X3 [Triplophysa rosa]|nr:leucine-rich repeat-containing protein 34 isoform X3 [Triplophysa rosa]
MCNNIEAEGAGMLAKSLHKNKSLRKLRMTGNKIGNKGAMQLAAMLQINATFEEVDVSDCDLTTQSVIAFAIVLNNNRRICAINISRPLLFSLQEETTEHMAHMLMVNKTLRELHMGKHGMTDTGVDRLCEALKMNSSLRYLDLRCNRITRDGARCLSEVLKQNSTLEILDLSSNCIEDDGAVYLSEAIKIPHSKLRALVDCFNPPMFSVFFIIIQFTHHNRLHHSSRPTDFFFFFLSRLSITGNNAGTAGLMCLYKAIRVNSSLTNVYIWGNKLEEPVCVAFSQLISSGRLLEGHTDVSPYEVDGHVFLAEASHGLRRHYYWTSPYGMNDFSNSALALISSHSLVSSIQSELQL